MPIDREPLFDKKQTGRRMYSLVRRFHGDLSDAYLQSSQGALPLSDLSLKEFYSLVRGIPYRRDTEPIEVVARPRHILHYSGQGMDCKKKAILIGSYFAEQGLRPLTQWRFIAVSSRPDKVIHHVLPQVKIDGEFETADATYPEYHLFQRPRYTAMEVLHP